MLFDHCTVLFIVYEGRHIINDDYNDDNLCCIWGGIFWGGGVGSIIYCLPNFDEIFQSNVFFFIFLWFYDFMVPCGLI